MIKKNMNNNDNKKMNKSVHVVDKVLAFIEKENVQPHSKWYFFFTNQFFWALGVTSICIGAFSFAIILLTYFNAEPGFYRIDYDSYTDFLFEWVPILWIISFSFFIYLGYKNIQHTKRGYRYPFSLIVLSGFALSIIGGILLFMYGIAGALDREFERHLPVYRSVQELKKDVALRPHRGGIGGEVVSVSDDLSSFVLRDFRGSVWVISTEELLDIDKEVILQNSYVRIIGIPSTTTVGVLGTSTMYACVVLPWELKDYQTPDASSAPHMRFKNIQSELRERKENIIRSNVCKGVQPYMIIQEIRKRANQ